MQTLSYLQLTLGLKVQSVSVLPTLTIVHS